MSDRIVRAITSDGMVQAAAVSSRELTERARQIHKTLPVATVALNGAKNAAVLAAQILAVEDAALAEKLDKARADMAAQIAEKEAKLQAEL